MWKSFFNPRVGYLYWRLAFGSLIETVQANFQLFHAICVLFQPALFFQVVCRPCPAKWSSLQKAGCIFTWRKNCFKMTSLQKASASNMIFTYHYVSTMSGEPIPFFCINQLFLSALYVTQAPSKRRGNPNGDIFGWFTCIWMHLVYLPTCGIFTYIWAFGWFLGKMLVNIPYMEHMGMDCWGLLGWSAW